MDWNLIGKVGAFLLIAISYLIRIPYARRADKKTVVRRDRDIAEIAVLVLAALGMMVLPLLAIVFNWPAQLSYNAQPLLVIIGYAVGIAAIWLFWRSHHDLGEQWSASLEIREGHQLITRGVYARIRHPMYSACFLWVIAQALLLPNWLGGLAGLVEFTTLYFERIAREERLMRSQFGDAWTAYCKTAGRLWPSKPAAAPALQ
jgi:protein-S-isoprenylcysteine O-methyltransferase Ste14